MLCPNCREKLNEDVVDNQNILHCSNCGGTFFQENGINRISAKSAQLLASDLKINEISDNEKLCPNDNTLLKTLQSEENIPSNVTLLHCDQCRGIFAYPNDLALFKKAQEAKIDYFKIWNIPLPSIRSIAVLSVILFVSVLSITAYSYLQRNLYSIQADDQIDNVFTTTSDRYLFVSFKTVSALKTKIVFYDRTTQSTIEKIINDKPVTFHQITTGDVNINNDIFYQIILTDGSGNQTRTEMRKLEISNSKQ